MLSRFPSRISRYVDRCSIRKSRRCIAPCLVRAEESTCGLSEFGRALPSVSACLDPLLLSCTLCGIGKVRILLLLQRRRQMSHRGEIGKQHGQSTHPEMYVAKQNLTDPSRQALAGRFFCGSSRALEFRPFPASRCRRSCSSRSEKAFSSGSRTSSSENTRPSFVSPTNPTRRFSNPGNRCIQGLMRRFPRWTSRTSQCSTAWICDT